MRPNEFPSGSLYDYAARALRAALREDSEAAGRIVQRLVQRHGADAVPQAILAWCDTVLDSIGAPEYGSGPVALGFRRDDSGAVTSATDVPPEVAWAGQVVAARAADDQDQFVALVNSVTTDDDWGARVLTLLMTCALNIRAARSPR